jgi:hypothetical protein
MAQGDFHKTIALKSSVFYLHYLKYF